jgi:hypothetical protein
VFVCEELDDRSILLFDPVLEATTLRIGDLYRRLDVSLRSREVIVLRASDYSTLELIRTDPILSPQLSGKGVLALVGPVNGVSKRPELVQIDGCPVPDEPVQIDHLCQVELNAILERSGAILAHDNYHYALPNGFHAPKFIRLANALRSIYDIRRITDWLLPHLDGVTVAIADTGSMLPLLINLRERALAEFGWRVEIATLDRYPQDTVSISEAIAAVRNRPVVVAAAAAGIDVRILFVVSVNSSGRLCRLLRELTPVSNSIVVVCETSDTDRDCDHVLLRVPAPRWPVNEQGKCEKCASEPVIHVHGESYELIPSIERKPELVTKALAEAHSDFWVMANDAEAVKLHVDVPYSADGTDDYRHFAVYLDTARLCGHRPFRERCLGVLVDQQRPDIILIPEHSSSQVVEGLCNEAYPGVLVRRLGSGRIPEDLDQQLSAAGRILIADDAIVTGATLLNLRVELFRVTQRLAIDPEVNAFVVVSRPSTEGPLKALSQRYRGRTVRNVLSGSAVLLPSGAACPWCQEHRLLASFRQRLSGNALSAAQRRIRKLEVRLEPPLLMVGDADGGANLMTEGSFFGRVRHDVAFAAGSGAVQSLIQGFGSTAGGLQLRVLNLPMAIDAYYEAPLLSSIVRTVDPIHVRYPGSDSLVGDAIARIDTSRAYPGTVAELTLAAIQRKIPSGPVRSLLQRCAAADDDLEMLGRILDSVVPG